MPAENNPTDTAMRFEFEFNWINANAEASNSERCVDRPYQLLRSMRDSEMKTDERHIEYLPTSAYRDTSAHGTTQYGISRFIVLHEGMAEPPLHCVDSKAISVLPSLRALPMYHSRTFHGIKIAWNLEITFQIWIMRVPLHRDLYCIKDLDNA
ncbi:hypothetical protein GQ600_2109 [Phytophthora cactorum]|nr:hypothetical protein GQ600_2109 [Phytophthora cactorum]